MTQAAASLAFVFPGQGSQSVGMLAELAAAHPEVKATFDEASQGAGVNLWALSQHGPEDDLNRTENTQPALLAGSVAVWRVWQKLGGAQPAQFAGHSLGEYSALVCAGALSLHDAAALVAERGRLMQIACEQSVGGMAALIGEDRVKVEELCRDFDIQAANFNAPGQIIVSGEKAKVDALVAAAKDRGLKRVIPLNVAGAYHSRLMEPARAAFASYLAGVDFKAPQFTVFTNTTGQAVGTPVQIREALVKQVVSSVLWEDCMRSAVAAGATEFYECGPGAVLAGLAKRTDRAWVVKSFAEYGDLPA